MNKENIFLKIINETVKDNSYLGDDCAYLKDLDIVISQDTLVEDVHFSTEYFTPYEIGKKTLLVNISDILASGANPSYITISLSGKLDENFIKEFYKGANEIAQKFNLKIIGGDLTGGEKITASAAIIGTTKNRRIASRKYAKEGYEVYLKGFHGSSAMGLKLLSEGKYDKENEFIKAHIEPELFMETSKYIAENIKSDYAMMDTSDGIYDALYKISKASNVGFEINYELIPKKINDKNMVLFGGEDFGLLICLSKHEKEIINKLNLQKIGVVKGSEIIIKEEGEILFLNDKSFDHFSK